MWTKEDEKNLLTYKYFLDSDEVQIKEKIKKILLNDKRIIHVLDNKELDEDEPDEYFGENIHNFYLISPTQYKSTNHLCYEVSYDSVNRYNAFIKTLNIVFYILCEQKNLIYNKTGIARHDLLSALIQDDFNWTDYGWGGKLQLVANVPNSTDTNYAVRTLTFQCTTDNNIVKTRNGDATIINQMGVERNEE